MAALFVGGGCSVWCFGLVSRFVCFDLVRRLWVVFFVVM